MSETTTSNVAVSKLSNRWAMKTGIGAVACLAVGVWGFMDASKVYPKRGYRAAEQYEQSYLEALRDSGRNASTASVEDPAAKYAELNKALGEGGKLSTPDQTLHDWLDSLKVVSKLSPENTKLPRKDFRTGLDVANGAERLDALQKSKEGKVSPLSAWDIPTQWLIMVVFAGVGAWLGWLYVQVSARKYRWDEASQTLTLPDGNSLTPADIAEFDKRKWDKFLVTLVVKGTHPTLANKQVVIDLYRHEPVEEWVLAMQRTAFPDEFAVEEEPKAEAVEVKTAETE